MRSERSRQGGKEIQPQGKVRSRGPSRIAPDLGARALARRRRRKEPIGEVAPDASLVGQGALLASVMVRNHERRQRIDTRLLGRIAQALLEEVLGKTRFHLSIQVVGRAEIVRLNETFLRHAGATDVIAFDYRDAAEAVVHGEIFVCLAVAREQAPRFRTSWERELVRYVVHGVLHLCGHDDRNRDARRQMKQAEDMALKQLSSGFCFGKIRR